MKESFFRIRLRMLAALFFLFVFCAGIALGEEVFPLIGEWAFSHEPAVPVLQVREDGTAVYDGRDWSWEADDSFLYLTAPEGDTRTLRYRAEDDRVLLFLPGAYTRRARLTEEEIWGAWILDGSEMSSFVFEKDGRFMEDGTFVGTYSVDEEAGSFLLHYLPAGYFEDTLCYFRREGEQMTVFYPWPLVPLQAAP